MSDLTDLRLLSDFSQLLLKAESVVHYTLWYVVVPVVLVLVLVLALPVLVNVLGLVWY
jgi:hypothetical protein